jgi:predicted metal-binding transcription factor (methanogenesis marker protein 9)
VIKTLYIEKYYHSKVDSKICEAAFDLINKKNESFTEQSWNCKIRTSFNFTDNISNMVELHTLKMNILSHIENYMHLNEQFFNEYIRNSWANIYEKDFFQEKHMHENFCERYISGVTYLSKNNSDLNLYSKSNPALETRVKPEFADIILFEDDRPHSVSPNLNDDLRISIAFNYVLVSEWKGKK